MENKDDLQKRMDDAPYKLMGRPVRSGLALLVTKYFAHRKYKVPGVWQALAFCQTEVGEVWEVLLQSAGGWVRNNKDKEQSIDYTEYLRGMGDELSDVIMMAIVTGLVAGVDPVRILIDKLGKAIGTQSEAEFQEWLLESELNPVGQYSEYLVEGYKSYLETALDASGMTEDEYYEYLNKPMRIKNVGDWVKLDEPDDLLVIPPSGFGDWFEARHKRRTKQTGDISDPQMGEWNPNGFEYGDESGDDPYHGE